MIRKIKYIGKTSKVLLVGLLVIFAAFRSYAQTYVSGPVTGSYTNGRYYHSSEITISPNTDIIPGIGQSVEFYIGTECQPLSTGFTNSQNYVLTTIPRIANYIPGQANGTGASGAYTNCDVMQSIQYYDGLGRPSQSIQSKASPFGNDIVQPFEYDENGREVKKYLPYVLTTNNGNGSYRPSAITEQSSFYAAPPVGIAPIPGFAFSKTVFEISPLNRILEQGAPGGTWQPSASRTNSAGRTVVVNYSANNSIDWGTDNTISRKVVLYNATVNANFSRTLATYGTYGDYQLSVSVTKDENWTPDLGRAGTTEEYKDKDGRVVLKRAYLTVDGQLVKQSTYYVYDDYGNLVFVLPPKANPDNGLTTTSNQTVLDNLCYQYQYDEYNRLINKRVPGNGWEETIYNKLDQVVFTQDAVQRANQERSFIKYDALGRVIMTGIEIGHNQTRAFIQNIVNGASDLWETRTSALGHWNSYTAKAQPGNTPNMKALVVNYYDNLNGIIGIPAYSAPAGISTATTGLQTATVTAIVKDDNTYIYPAYDQNYTSIPVLWKTLYYDQKSRNVATYAQHYQGGSQNLNKFDLVKADYNDFTSEVKKVAREHYNGSTSTPLHTIGNRYVYDHMGRKKETWLALANNTTTLPGSYPLMLNQVVYNELGQRQARRQHSTDNGSSFLQSTSYTYNERGWLSKLNSALFEEQLQYNDLSAVAGITPTPQFSGNIASQSWGTQAAPNAKSYVYTYDLLNRLTSGYSTSNFNNNERAISYDMTGNITALKRDINNVLADNLTYSYASGGNETNQLQSVTDASGDTNPKGYKSGTYAYNYDANGNVLSDASKTLTIAYNVFNLPRTNTLTSPSATIKYTYDGAGNKLRRSVVNGTTVNTDYIVGIQYTGNTVDFIQIEDGRILTPATTANYEYTLKDHLGNTRVTFASSSGGNTATQVDDYMPFGLDLAVVANSPKNQYLYNGKEWQDGISLYDYGARFYDPVIGRWTSVDPSAEEGDQESLTPYQYGLNNPIRYDDPDGRCPTCVVGFFIGAGVDYGFQVAGNFMSGKRGMDAFTDVNKTSILVSGLAGAATSGVSALGAKGAFAAAGRLSKYAPEAASTAIDVAESVTKQLTSTDGSKVTLAQTASDVISNKIGGAVANKLDGVLNIKTAERQLDRAQRVAGNPPLTSGRANNVSQAQAKLNGKNYIKQAVGGTTGNLTQNASNGLRAEGGKSGVPFMPNQQDNTKYKPLVLRN
ncbi:DUF6443 domain-containing protein [Mucilaginibacter sp. HD30]